MGGLGEAVAGSTYRVHPVPVQIIGINDKSGIGPEDDLRQKHGLTAESIAIAARKAIALKKQ
jgi:transketolase